MAEDDFRVGLNKKKAYEHHCKRILMFCQPHRFTCAHVCYRYKMKEKYKKGMDTQYKLKTVQMLYQMHNTNAM